MSNKIDKGGKNENKARKRKQSKKTGFQQKPDRQKYNLGKTCQPTSASYRQFLGEAEYKIWTDLLVVARCDILSPICTQSPPDWVDPCSEHSRCFFLFSRKYMIFIMYIKRKF